jgi:hypothetical protein
VTNSVPCGLDTACGRTFVALPHPVQRQWPSPLLSFLGFLVSGLTTATSWPQRGLRAGTPQHALMYSFKGARLTAGFGFPPRRFLL